MKIKHVSLIDYYEGHNRHEVDFVLKYGELKPLDLFEFKDIIECKLGFVKDAQHLYNTEGLVWNEYITLIKNHTGLSDNQICSESIYKLHESRLWLKESLDIVNEVESIKLSHESSSEEIRAGIDEFNVYGIFPQIFNICGRDLTKYEEVRNLPYSLCLTAMSYEASENRFHKRLSEIINKKK